ncbi:hypothetical protein QBC46DRAFT_426235 [Diplogelasinospora grovesii]|uniref:NACHT domain-containing protein n=1 Tax=Diplogelasinospora grovesii TaxID=303347 RepID=A0AAN6S7A7_9PEZI|nr:hypothetical protein QBC46DRAFT_426235 [Diplogelasinospora grovesii]
MVSGLLRAILFSSQGASLEGWAISNRSTRRIRRKQRSVAFHVSTGKCELSPEQPACSTAQSASPPQQATKTANHPPTASFQPVPPEVQPPTIREQIAPPNNALWVDPGVAVRGEPQAAALSTSQRLWNDAYDILENDSGTEKLVKVYMRTLVTVLKTQDANGTTSGASDISGELKDPGKRQMNMRQLVKDGLARVDTESKIAKGVGDVAGFILKAKGMIDLAVNNIPQAALPWAGVCVALQILLNPAKATKSNLEGITHVVQRMDWYCALTDHVLNEENINISGESFKPVLQQLEERIISLYKALLLYQMKSVCSYYRNQGIGFLRNLANLDDWDGDLRNVTDAEAALQKDSGQYNNQHAKSLLGHLVKMQMDEKDHQCLRDLHLTNPRDDKKRIEQTKGGLLQDSYQWILENHDFRRWRDTQESRLLWIKGDPGKGKTMLLCSIIDELETADAGLLTYFFCQGTDSRINNATAVLRGLVYLLVDQQPSLISYVRERYDGTGKALFENANAWIALCDIFATILQDLSVKKAYIIVDALDECIVDSPLLLDFLVQTSSAHPHVKWIVSSRNWPEIEKQLGRVGEKVKLSLELNAESVSIAVSKYIQHKVDRLATLHKYDGRTRDAVQRHLSSHANDTFLWVALVCQDLDKISRWKVLEKLNAFPQGLDSLYKRMMDQICSSDDADLCKKILTTLTVVYQPVTLKELTSLVGIMPEHISDDPESLEEIIGLCGSFLTLRQETVYFVHQSAQDFLLAKGSGAIFPSGTGEAHYAIFSRSLDIMSRTLRRDIYGLGAPGFPIAKVKQPDPDPLAQARYSCIYWVDHLRDWCIQADASQNATLRDITAVEKFLREKYLYWLEALSLLEHVPEGVLSMGKLNTVLQERPEALQFIDLVQDADRFIRCHKWAIEDSPLQTYASALVFSPAHSVIKESFKHEEPQWIKTRPAIEDGWGTCLQTLQGHSDVVTSATFSPDSKNIVSASWDKTVKIWDAAAGRCLKTLLGHSGQVNSVVFSPDSRQVTSASGDGTVKVWDVATGQCVQTLQGSGGYSKSVAFSPNSNNIASAMDLTVTIWAVATGQRLRMLKGHIDQVASVAFSSDSKNVVSASRDETVKIWDVTTGQCLLTLKGHSWHVFSAVFSPSSKQVVSASEDRTIKIWDVAASQCVLTLKGHKYGATSVAFSPDSKQIASASEDRTIMLWDASTGQCMQTIKDHSIARSVAFSPNSKQLVSAWDCTIKIWDVTANQCQRMPLEDHSRAVSSVAFSPDIRQAASSSYDGTIKIWDTATGQCIQTLEGHRKPVWSVAFSHDSKQAASGSYDHTVRIWDVATGQCLFTLEGHSEDITSVAFSHDSKQVGSASYDGTVNIWNAATGQCLLRFGNCLHIRSAAFSPDLKQVVVSTKGGNPGARDTTEIWDVAAAQRLLTLKGHSEVITLVAFSPDSKQVVSASRDRTVKIWDALTGQCLQTLDVSRELEAISFDSTGSCLLTDIGDIVLPPPPADTALAAPQTARFQRCGLSLDGVWITWNSENMLWLPPEYRRSCSAVAGSTVVIGTDSRRVLVFNFADKL